MNDDTLKLKKIEKSINGVKIVDNVTASFIPGRVTALIGPNGAGKTTLFHIIGGALRSDGGSMLYRGEDISSLKPSDVARKGVGRLFQDIRIFNNLTVFENVVSACYQHNEEKPWFPFIHHSSLKSLQEKVADRAKSLIFYVGLDNFSSYPGRYLSYGQQKLLAIARLLAGDFSLLLLDEPTSGLNPLMIKIILNILEKIIKDDPKKTIVIVEHNMSVVKEIASWVYFMNEGKISFFGRTDHVLGNHEVREIYLGL